jgi:hypothetical protein
MQPNVVCRQARTTSHRSVKDLLLIMSDAAASGNGNNLIDFGNRRRSSPSQHQRKQVRFSEDITIHRFQYPSSEEVYKRWHSKRDKSLFTKEHERDTRSIRYLLSITPTEEVEKETLYWCIGLEAHVSSKVTRFLKDEKRGNIRSIVMMQDCLSDDQLAAYAMTRTFRSRERAQKLAAGYWAILS